MNWNGKTVKTLVMIGSIALAILLIGGTMRLITYGTSVTVTQEIELIGVFVGIAAGGGVGYDQLRKHTIDRKQEDDS